MNEIEPIFDSLSEADYQTMRKNVIRVGEKIRGGFYFNRAMNKTEDICFKA